MYVWGGGGGSIRLLGVVVPSFVPRLYLHTHIQKVQEERG